MIYVARAAAICPLLSLSSLSLPPSNSHSSHSTAPARRGCSSLSRRAARIADWRLMSGGAGMPLTRCAAPRELSWWLSLATALRGDEDLVAARRPQRSGGSRRRSDCWLPCATDANTKISPELRMSKSPNLSRHAAAVHVALRSPCTNQLSSRQVMVNTAPPYFMSPRCAAFAHAQTNLAVDKSW